VPASPRSRWADATNYSASYIAAIETGRRLPRVEFARRADLVLAADGLLERVLGYLTRSPALPDWFRPWVDTETRATALCLCASTLVPGLLQTEAYARAQLGDEARVAARLARQAILTRDDPPVVVALLDERVLRYPMGGSKVMAEQCRHLLDLPENVIVQLIPVSAGTCLHLDGSFELATLEGREVAYVDSPAQGFVVDSPPVVSQLRHRWEAIRAEALTRRDSAAAIAKEAEQWESET
jgi:hypothetical protein